MKTIFPSSILILLLTLFLACSGNSSKNDFSKNQKTEEKSVKIAIEGMSCMSCVANVKKNLSSIDGVKEVKVSLQDKNATVKYDPKKVTIEQLKNTINKIGYKAGDTEELKE